MFFSRTPYFRRTRYTEWYQRLHIALACLFACAITLKLSFAYCFLSLLIVLWAITTWPVPVVRPPRLYTPFLWYIGVTVLFGFFGLNLAHSMKDAPSLLFFSLAIPCLADSVGSEKGYRVLVSLVIGQTIAGIRSILAAAFPYIVVDPFPGKVTESGQIGLTLFVAAGLFLVIVLKRYESPWKTSLASEDTPLTSELVSGVIYFLLSLGLGFWEYLHIPERCLLPLLLAWGLTVGFLIVTIFRRLSLKGHGEAIRYFLISFAIPTLLMTLLVNLKRGPWTGVAIGGLLLLLLYGRRFILPMILVAALLLITVAPLRTRLAHSSRDFFISGGRNVIWSIGTELAPAYPLGIGYSNSSFLQKFSTQIPPDLKHFHNDALNLLVESGPLALAIFAWWVVALLVACFHRAKKLTTPVMLPALGCAFISWQIGGTVEYNIGDSEVALVVYLCAAATIALTEKRRIPQTIS